MEKEQFTQTEYVQLFPVSAKEGKIYKKKPNFKKLEKQRTLILLIGLSDNKKIKRFAKKKWVRRITYSDIANELQEEEITSWNEFHKKANTEFESRVTEALSESTALVERCFNSLDIRLGFLELIMEKNIANEVILIVSKVELRKNKALKKQFETETILKGIDKLYLL